MTVTQIPVETLQKLEQAMALHGQRTKLAKAMELHPNTLPLVLLKKTATEEVAEKIEAYFNAQNVTAA